MGLSFWSLDHIAFSWRVIPKPFRIKGPWESWNYQEKVSQLLGVVEPEKVRKSSRHEHLERDEIALAKLVMKEGEKPGKFLLPHGIILLEFGPYRIFMEGNPEGIQNQRPLGIMELSVTEGVPEIGQGADKPIIPPGTILLRHAHHQSLY